IDVGFTFEYVPSAGMWAVVITRRTDMPPSTSTRLSTQSSARSSRTRNGVGAMLTSCISSRWDRRRTPTAGTLGDGSQGRGALWAPAPNWSKAAGYPLGAMEGFYTTAKAAGVCALFSKGSAQRL